VVRSWSGPGDTGHRGGDPPEGQMYAIPAGRAIGGAPLQFLQHGAIARDTRKMTPLFCTFFFFILTLNLMGIIPIFATATANVNVTAALAMITFCFMFFGAIYRNGFKGFIKSFMPSGIPWPILILLTPLEFLGVFIRTFALTVRLFANMLAGHMVILALLGLVGVLGFVALPTVLLAIFISLLEIFVAFLQAYIFTLLSSIFIGQAYHPEH
jgi:F-type H+-transporting ATPase subunit a